MQILELNIQNFGIYEGEHTFDLKPRDGVIVIIGGKNGAGKTTLLEALRLCLYGKRSLGDRITQNKYDQYILSRIHRRRNNHIPIKYISVALTIEFSQFGEGFQYEIIRSWKRKGSKVYEELNIYKNEKILEGVAEERWQDFIMEIIPPKIANLFFFDGEKIQALTTESTSSHTLEEEISRLLGFRLLERLQSDLDIYLYRQRKDAALIETIRELESCKEHCEELDNKYLSSRQARAAIQTSYEHILGKIEEVERQISRESSGFAFAREELKSEIGRIEAYLDQAQNDLHSLAAGLLPFALVPDLCHDLEMQLQSESRLKKSRAAKIILDAKIAEIQNAYHEDQFWHDIRDNHLNININRIINKFDTLLSNQTNSDKSEIDIPFVHDVSDQTKLQILSWIEDTRIDTPKHLLRVSGRLEKFSNERDITINRLQQIPEDDILRPLVSELNRLNQKLGEIEARLNKGDQEISTLGLKRQDAKRRLEKVYNEMRGGEKLERRLELVPNVQQVISSFQSQVTVQKVEELGELISARFNEISRKPDLIKRVKIDSKNFDITLFGQDEQPVSKQILSAGEKQIFSISILWALRQLSGRPFPIVIDTPLGRLDSDHRKNLIENFFPFVSHQVLLFSTDTEVDQEYFQALKPYISHAYHLDYDPQQGSTLVKEGYLWSDLHYAT